MTKINTDYGAQALDLNQLIDIHGGTGIVSGCSASVGANAMEVDVATGTARVNGTNYSISASTVLLESSNSNPRKDLVVVDNTGSVTYIKGTPEEAKPAGATRRNTRRPRPADTSGSDVAVIAEVWVGASASDIVSGDISDRRIFTHSDGFKDTNGDGVAELDDSHADFGGGDARNVGALDTVEISSLREIRVSHENDQGQNTFPATATGLRDAINSIGTGSAEIKLPAGSIDLGTSGITIPNKCSLIGVGKRATVINASDGIGTAIATGGSSSRLEHFSLLGDTNGSSADIGIQPATSSGFTTGYNLEISSFWKNLYLDNHWNSRWFACQFDNSRTESGGSQGASVHVDVASGSNNDTRFVACTFGLNNTRMVWNEANNVTFVAPHGEGNAGDYLYYHEAGNQLNIKGAVHHLEDVGSAGIRSNGGSCRFEGFLDRDSGLAAAGTAVSVGGQTDPGVFKATVTGSWNGEYSGSKGGRRVFNGVGHEDANAETPTATAWQTGDVVDFTDTGDGSGSGVYQLLLDETWSQIGST